ncbi:MAG: diguanylate cyclase [Candidatus Omnitrophica bacterium]|nr:diguanylate cyclase [Candidatus Omnitrophota bacterium]
MDYLEKILNPGDEDLPLASRLLYQLIDEKYRALLDESSDLMGIVDRDGKFIYVNRQLADSLGYTKKDMLRIHMYDIIAKESLAAFTEKTKEFLKSGRLRMPDFVLKTKWGGKVVGEMNSIAFCDNEGRYCGAKAVFKDRTKLLEIQRLEKKYESMLEDGIDTLDYIIMILDKELHIRWASSSVMTYFGLDKTGIIGEDVRRVFEEKLKEVIQEHDVFLANAIAAYEDHRVIESFECQVKRPGADDISCVEHWSYPITHGELSGGRIEIFRDITRRKKSEEMLEYYYKKIHTIMGHAVEGIVELRTDNTIQFVNKSFLDIMGYSEEEMTDRSLYDFILSEERRHLVSIKLIRRSREIVFVKKNGTYLYALASSIPLVFGTHSPHTLCFISDITETKMASVKLRDANLTLRALNASLVENSLKDVRTGVYNERYLHDRLTEEVRRARRYFRPFSLIMIDLDFFKAVNDAYGHLFGDVVLRGFADLLKTNVRATDIVVRSGGEEFVVFCPDTDSYGALTVAHKVARALEKTRLGDTGRRLTVTASMGIASYPEAGVFDPLELLEVADQAMYQSKARGRNRITTYRKPGHEQEVRSEPAEVPGMESVAGIKERLRYVNARNEEAVLESLRPLILRLNGFLGYDPGYADRLVKDVESLCVELSLPEPETHRARRAALLCNLGFLSLPREILGKTSLTDQEVALVRKHPFLSADILKDIAFLDPVKEDILAHHERFDGTGYPRGLKEKIIPMPSRMIAVAEAYEAMTSPRPYRTKPFGRKEISDVFLMESGRQFDPAIVSCFLRQMR